MVRHSFYKTNKLIVIIKKYDDRSYKSNITT